MKTPASVIVLAILGLLYAALQVAGVIFTIVLILYPDLAGDPMLTDTVYLFYTFVTLALTIFLSTLLVAVSIASFTLKGWARRAMLLYAWLSIGYAAVDTLVSIVYYIPKSFALEHPHGPPPQAIFATTLIFGGTFIFQLVHPLFALFIFTRPRIITAFHGPHPALGFTVLPPPESTL